VAGEKEAWGPCLAGCHRDPAPEKWMRMDGWMDGPPGRGAIEGDVLVVTLHGLTPPSVYEWVNVKQL